MNKNMWCTGNFHNMAASTYGDNCYNSDMIWRNPQKSRIENNLSPLPVLSDRIWFTFSRFKHSWERSNHWFISHGPVSWVDGPELGMNRIKSWGGVEMARWILQDENMLWRNLQTMWMQRTVETKFFSATLIPKPLLCPTKWPGIFSQAMHRQSSLEFL